MISEDVNIIVANLATTCMASIAALALFYKPGESCFSSKFFCSAGPDLGRMMRRCHYHDDRGFGRSNAEGVDTTLSFTGRLWCPRSRAPFSSVDRSKESEPQARQKFISNYLQVMRCRPFRRPFGMIAPKRNRVAAIPTLVAADRLR